MDLLAKFKKSLPKSYWTRKGGAGPRDFEKALMESKLSKDQREEARRRWGR